MPKVVTVCGLPGVGKSSALAYAKALAPNVRLASEHSGLIHDVLAAAPGSQLAGALAYILAEYRLALECPDDCTVLRDRGLEDTQYVMTRLINQGELPKRFLDDLSRPGLLRADHIVLLTADEQTRRRRLRDRRTCKEHDRASAHWEQKHASTYEAWLRGLGLPFTEVATDSLSAPAVGAVLAEICEAVSP